MVLQYLPTARYDGAYWALFTRLRPRSRLRLNTLPGARDAVSTAARVAVGHAEWIKGSYIPTCATHHADTTANSFSTQYGALLWFHDYGSH